MTDDERAGAPRLPEVVSDDASLTGVQKALRRLEGLDLPLVFRGYDPAVVDGLLGALRDDLQGTDGAGTTQAGVEMVELLERVAAEVASYRSDANGAIRQQQLAAEAEVTAVLDAALEDAVVVVEAAKADGQELLESAREEARRLLEVARAESDEVRREALRFQQALVDQLGALVEEAQDVPREFRNILTKVVLEGGGPATVEVAGS